ncbi:MAG: hypothetical protein ACK5LC_18615 [Coprobacillaceae bacterium]
MRKIEDRLSRLEVYNEIKKYDYINSYALASKVNMSHRKVRQCVADLREMFANQEVEKYVCICNYGYFLSNDIDDAEYSFNEKRKKALTMLKEVNKHKEAFYLKDNVKMEV